MSFPSLTNILQYHGDDQSTGLNPTEYTLTPANVTVGSFGKLFSVTLDDQVYAQPLVDTGVTINNGVNTTTGAAGVHNVVYVCTESDEIYAIDTATGAILWARTFLSLSTTGDINNTLGATAIAAQNSTDANSTRHHPQHRHHRHAGHRQQHQHDVRRRLHQGNHRRRRLLGAAAACHQSFRRHGSGIPLFDRHHHRLQ